MLEITSIKNGFVLDHIKAGRGIKIFNFLNLVDDNNEVALIINAKSNKCGKKDIIKIENLKNINTTLLAILSPGITINEVKNEKIINKIKPNLPKEVKGVLKCENPRCITSEEKYVQHVFHLVDNDKGSYKCDYCDKIIIPSEV